MTTNDIKTLISSDESRTLELKKTTGELKDGIHSAYAFLSTEGGWLIFGVTPEHPENWSINGDFIVVTFPRPNVPQDVPQDAPQDMDLDNMTFLIRHQYWSRRDLFVVTMFNQGIKMEHPHRLSDVQEIIRRLLCRNLSYLFAPLFCISQLNS